jgi:hypothetical protein
MQREPMWMQDCRRVLLTYSTCNRDEASLPLIMTDKLSYRLAGLRSSLSCSTGLFRYERTE